jgi:tetratricopeptide (TPR) repeat protein
MRVLLILLTLFLGCVPKVPQEEAFRAISLNQTNSLLRRGMEHLVNGRYKESEAAFLLVLELEQSAVALDGLGCVLLHRDGDRERARGFFQEAVRTDPFYGNGYASLGYIEHIDHHFEEAKVLYEKSLELDPLNIIARRNYAAVLKEMGASEKIFLEEVAKLEIVKDLSKKEEL